MRAVLQRVIEANVSIDGSVSGMIEKGLVVLLGVTEADAESDMKWICDKLINLRIFEDENDKMNLSLLDVSGSVLLISQFTLYGDARKGRRPSFTKAATPKIAEPLYEKCGEYLKSRQINVQFGIFGANMKVSLVNDGPVTILLDSSKTF